MTKALTSGTLVTAKYRTNVVSQQVAFGGRYLEVRPVRVR
jgi:hypothetical protein